MDRKHNKNIVLLARTLRKNMTKEERKLWYDFLRNYLVKFTRQKVLGQYIADFYCARANVVVELDGSGHFSEDGVLNDRKRTEYLGQYGIKVIRVSNLEVLKNFEGVCMFIEETVTQALGLDNAK